MIEKLNYQPCQNQKKKKEKHLHDSNNHTTAYKLPKSLLSLNFQGALSMQRYCNFAGTFLAAICVSLLLTFLM
ncbi:hypothetical protein BC008_13800 [Mastigocoleus testarum BC008]|uniref:Uncharacterized protein n=1 Tax=Mastigocoleus testarum BC008 TaxID=371196 RepID=A0A0V7ZGF3_9CYAN|nr:hypothetical protein BC008_13800 [Mastigocoleus testarum BC008]